MPLVVGYTHGSSPQLDGVRITLARTDRLRAMAVAFAAASRPGADATDMWTAFGLTNVAIHQVNTAMELGGVQMALEIGLALGASGLLVERQVRHALDVAQAYSARNRRDDGLAAILDAEQIAPWNWRAWLPGCT